MLTIDSMPSRIKKDKKSENKYDGLVFATEIAITVFLLFVIYLIYN